MWTVYVIKNLCVRGRFILFCFVCIVLMEKFPFSREKRRTHLSHSACVHVHILHALVNIVQEKYDDDFPMHKYKVIFQI